LSTTERWPSSAKKWARTGDRRSDRPAGLGARPRGEREAVDLLKAREPERVRQLLDVGRPVEDATPRLEVGESDFRSVGADRADAAPVGGLIEQRGLEP